LGIRAANVIARNEREVQAARHADRLVDGAQFRRRNDRADALFRGGQYLLGPLDPVAARRAHVQLDDADIGGWKEVGADDWEEGAGGANQDGDAAEDELAPDQYSF